MNEAETYPCATCKHRERSWLKETFIGNTYLQCERPNQVIDPVSGKPKRAYLILERRYNMGCTYEGRFHSDRKGEMK